MRVLASTSNLGPGFDTLGIALQLYNRLNVTLTRSHVITFVSSPGTKDQETANIIVAEAAQLFSNAPAKNNPA